MRLRGAVVLPLVLSLLFVREPAARATSPDPAPGASNRTADEVEQSLADFRGSDVLHRTAAAERLGRLRDPRAIEPFAEEFRRLCAKWPTNEAAGRRLRGELMVYAEALAAIEDPRAVTALVDLLAERIPPVAAVVGTMVEAVTDSAEAEMMAMMGRYLDPAVEALVENIGRIRGPHAVPPLMQALKSRDSLIRALAADVLGRIKDQRAVESLLPLLGDASMFARRNATKALGEIGDPAAVDALCAVLSGNEEAQRDAAAEALGNIKNPRAIPCLAAAMRGNSRRAAWALGRISDLRALEVLEAAFHTGDSEQRRVATAGLGESSDPHAVKLLLEALRDPALYGIVTGPLARSGRAEAWAALFSELGSADRERSVAAFNSLTGVNDERLLPALLAAVDTIGPPGRGSVITLLGYNRAAEKTDRLLTLLADPDPTRREAAVTALRENPKEPRATAALIGALKDPQALVRRAAVMSLDLFVADPIEQLAALVSDADAGIREAVFRALVRRKDPRLAEHLRSLLRDESVPLRTQVVAEIARSSDPRRVETLAEASRDADPEIRKMAIVALGKTRDSGAIGPVLAALRDRYTTVAGAAAEALVELRDLGSVEHLLPLAQDGDKGYRFRVLDALARMNDPRVPPLLIAALGEADPGVRWKAALALGTSGDQRAVEPLLDALRDSEVNVRNAAVLALGGLADLRAVEPLLALLNGDGSLMVKNSALRSLGKLRDQRAVPALLTFLGDQNAGVRDTVAVALAMIGGPGVRNLLREALRSPEPLRREGAACALGKTRDSEAAAPLLAALRDAVPAVREMAANALGDLRDAGALDALIAALEDPDKRVQNASARALSLITGQAFHLDAAWWGRWRESVKR